MPIYEFECPVHGRFEEIRPFYQFSELSYCRKCGDKTGTCTASPLVPSLVSMHPDTLWSGVNTQQGYFTSKRQRLNYLKKNNIERVERGMIEEANKKAKSRFKNIQQKNENKLEKFLTKELASVTID